jgi:hypothetical protein
MINLWKKVLDKHMPKYRSIRKKIVSTRIDMKVKKEELSYMFDKYRINQQDREKIIELCKEIE